MWERMLDRMLNQMVRKGAMELTYPDTTQRFYGDPNARPVRVTLRSPDLPRRLILNPDLASGEGYMNGELTIGDDDLYGYLGLIIANMGHGHHTWVLRANMLRRLWMRRFRQFNPMPRSRANVAHHYDLSGALYDLFLDEDKQYSCAYFRTPEDTLEQAQANKKAHIGAKLLIEPGMRVLDIGCGWGGMGLTLAQDFGARVVGVTLSEEQHKIARQRATKAGLSDRVDFRLQDYRKVEGKFDRIVSVGMFEHVGVPHYREYFRHVHDRLTDDGVALIHTIGRATPPAGTSAWVDKYIFPGGYVPAMSETMAAVEHEDLYATDVEIWRLHYAQTICHWYQRFVAQEETARALYDERFCRMWRYYLVASELTFRLNRQVVFQFQLTRRQRAVPLTRDYLYAHDAIHGVRMIAE